MKAVDIVGQPPPAAIVLQPPRLQAHSAGEGARRTSADEAPAPLPSNATAAVAVLDVRRIAAIFTAMKLHLAFASLALSLLLGATGSTAADSLAKTPPAVPESFQVRNQKFGDLLRPEEANSAVGTPIVLYPAQAWKCMTWKFVPAGDTVFQLQNLFTSKTFAAEAKADQAEPAVKQANFAKEAAERPKWQFTKLDDGTYRISDPQSGKALTAVKTGTSSTVTIVLAPWKESGEQKWELVKTDPAKLSM